MSRRIKSYLELVLTIAILIGIVFLIIYFSKSQATQENVLRVYFLDVGQGDASYIKTPDGSDILIDGGPDNTVINELGKVMSFGDREISLLILSHPHADHLSGLIEV